MSTQTKHREIRDALLEEIKKGRYLDASRFPSDVALARRFKTSRQTVVRAVAELQILGYLSRCRGSGTYLTAKARKVGGIIGMILPISGSEVFHPICREITQLAQADGCSILLADIIAVDPLRRIEEIRRVAKSFVDNRVKGIVFHPVDCIPDARQINSAALSIFSEAGIPLVLVDCDCVDHPRRSEYDVVGADDFDAGYRIAKLTQKRGARRALFALVKNVGASWNNRCRGARAAFAEQRLTFRDIMVKPYDMGAIRKAIPRFRPDAIICGNDHLASELMLALEDAGVNVPGDVMVAGFDDVNYARLTRPGITSARQPCAEIGAAAYGTLMERIEFPKLPARTVLLKTNIMERASTLRKGKVEK